MTNKLILALITISLSLVSLFFNSGCAVVAVGGTAAGVAYVAGDLETVLADDIHSCFHATKEAMNDLGYILIGEASDAINAKVIAKNSQGERVTVLLQKITHDSTKTKIRIGLFGDKKRSQLILKQIEQNL